jgi:hydroxymethylglutaryl-CoA reductase (NADPH)
MWKALFKFSHRYLDQFITQADLENHFALLKHLPEWWHDLEQMPRTLIQNDFVPKNCTVRSIAGQQRLCVYDWELAIAHLPQRDLCEFLCYVLPADVSPEVARSVVNLHRQTLERLSGLTIDAASWNYGFRLSLQDYLINRLAFEIVFEEFEPRNIGKLYRTLWHLMELFPA